MKNKGVKSLLKTLGLAAAVIFLSMKTEAQKWNPYVATNQNGIGYNSMNNKSERDSLIQSERDSDEGDVYHIPPRPAPQYSGGDIFDCDQYTLLGLTNNNDWGENINLYGGYSGDNLDSIYAHQGTLKNMGKNGIPYMQVQIFPSDGSEGHTQLGAITGDSLDGNPSIYKNWNLVEPQFDHTDVKPGEDFIPKDCDVEIKQFYVKENEIQGRYLSSIPLVKFHLENGIATNTYVNSDMYTNRTSAMGGTGLEDKLSDLEVKVYPNPAIDEINIKYNSEKLGKVYAEIYSSDGRLVDEEINESYLGENNFSVDISDKSKGIYFVNFTSDGKTKTEKIIKK